MADETSADGREADRAAPTPGDRGLWFGIVAVLLVAIAGMYIWKVVAVSDVRGDMEARQDSLLVRSQQALETRTERLLRMSGVPLAWALRPELTRRNYEQVNAYLSEFVQEPGVERVVVTAPGDSILASTDRRLEGRSFSSVLPAELLEIRDARVERVDGEIRVAVPVMGPTRALGVLVFTYRPPVDEDGGPAPGDTAPGATEAGPPPG